MKKEDWAKIIEDLENLADEEKFHLLEALEKGELTKGQHVLIIQKAKEQDEIDKKELNRLDAELGSLRIEEAKYQNIEKEMIDKLVYAEEQQSDRVFEKMKTDLDTAYKKDYESMENELRKEEKELDKLETQVNGAIEKDKLEEAREKLK